jgi:hypothetical protein
MCYNRAAKVHDDRPLAVYLRTVESNSIPKVVHPNISRIPGGTDYIVPVRKRMQRMSSQ